MRYLPPPRYAAPHFVAVFGTNLIYTVCLCIYRLFFLVVALARQLPNEQQIHSSAFLVLSLPQQSLPLSLSPPSLSLIELPKKWVNCEPIFRHYCDNRCTRFSTTEREGGRGDRGRKKETAIITRATGKSENKTCHKINKAKKKLNKNFKCKMHSKFAELLQCAIKVHARRVLAL